MKTKIFILSLRVGLYKRKKYNIAGKVNEDTVRISYKWRDESLREKSIEQKLANKSKKLFLDAYTVW